MRYKCHKKAYAVRIRHTRQLAKTPTHEKVRDDINLTQLN